MKGLSDCHVSNDKYREGWERVFGKKEEKDDCMQCEKCDTILGCPVAEDLGNELADEWACDFPFCEEGSE